ncbi:MAG TPA: hypothetical protein VFY45_00590 [Baekduia sp.]|nr:hypothetical protein [Baekduia sp.]
MSASLRTSRTVALVAVAVGALTAVAPAAHGATYRSCDGEAVVVAVRSTTCLEGGRVYRSYLKACVAKPGDTKRLTCRVRSFKCVFKAQSSVPKAISKTEDVVGFTTCSRDKRRVVFAVTRTIAIP